jgi:hypothetical protein
MNSSSIKLNNLRQLMKSKKYFNEIIDAYIVPTTDPHRVIILSLLSFFYPIFYLNRMNMLLIVINEENLFQILLDQMVFYFIFI